MGIFSLELEFEGINNQFTLADIIKINEYGRRIYPQFLGDRDESKKESNFSGRVGKPKNFFLADRIRLLKDRNELVKETFEDEGILKGIKISKVIRYFFGDEISLEADKKKPKIIIKPAVDDRMFVICHVLSNEFSKQIVVGMDGIGDREKLNYETDMNAMDQLYKFTFIEGWRTCRNLKMAKELLDEHIYERWMAKEEDVSIYAVTRYSFMLLSNESDTAKDTLNKHMRTLYAEMQKLVLLQRAALLQFEESMSQYADKRDDDDSLQKIKDVYKKYLIYKTKLSFQEVTAQEQGIELYGMMRRSMDIDRREIRLREDIQDLKNEQQLVAEEEHSKKIEKTNAKINKLTWVVGIITTFSFVWTAVWDILGKEKIIKILQTIVMKLSSTINW